MIRRIGWITIKEPLRKQAVAPVLYSQLERRIFSLIRNSGRIRSEEILRTLKKGGVKERDIEEALKMMMRYDIITVEKGETIIVPQKYIGHNPSYRR